MSEIDDLVEGINRLSISNNSAIIMQKYYRGYLCRKRLKCIEKLRVTILRYTIQGGLTND